MSTCCASKGSAPIVLDNEPMVREHKILVGQLVDVFIDTNKAGAIDESAGAEGL